MDMPEIRYDTHGNQYMGGMINYGGNIPIDRSMKRRLNDIKDSINWLQTIISNKETISEAEDEIIAQALYTINQDIIRLAYSIEE